MIRLLFCFTACLAVTGAALAANTASVRLAEGFGLPVGIENGKKYYKARGMRPNGHLGEDWNGIGGGNTDLGDPVHAVGNGLVVYARDFRAGWGNVVIVRHAYREGVGIKYVDSLYGHLHKIFVREGQRVDRGDKVGTIGTAHGQYSAHLHFEMRKDLRIGMYRSMFKRDYSAYFDPTQFIIRHGGGGGGGRTVSVPINTFPNQSGYAAASQYVNRSRGDDKPSPVTSGGKRLVFGSAPRWGADTRKVTSESKQPANSKSKGNFRVDRFGDLRK